MGVVDLGYGICVGVLGGRTIIVASTSWQVTFGTTY
jgi:hypothetical protein